MSEKLSGRIAVANQCNSELIRLDIATEVSERFDCGFICPRNFMISGHSFLSDYNLYFILNIIKTLNLCKTTIKIKINYTICGLRSPEVC